MDPVELILDVLAPKQNILIFVAEMLAQSSGVQLAFNSHLDKPWIHHFVIENIEMTFSILTSKGHCISQHTL